VIVAIESASTDPSIALAQPDGQPIHVEGWSAMPRQAHELLSRLEAALRAAGGELADVSAIGIGTGPGSFTGLRVGMSLGKGLCLALGVPLVGVPSLRAWLDAEPEALAAVGRAGARDAYLLLRDEEEPRIVDREELPAGVGDRPVVAAAELAEAFGLTAARPPRHAAGAVAAAAAARLRMDPRGDDLARLEPTYLRAPRGVGQLPHADAG
jgi:tRNA threonylcarbamoyladenosine biosynthesis protein TsaB